MLTDIPPGIQSYVAISFFQQGVQLLRSICISSSVLSMLKSVSESFQLSSDVVISETFGTVAITIEQK